MEMGGNSINNYPGHRFTEITTMEGVDKTHFLPLQCWKEVRPMLSEKVLLQKLKSAKSNQGNSRAPSLT